MNTDLQGNYLNYNISDFMVSEHDKESPEYLMAKTDDIINRLVLEGAEERKEMLKMRSFRSGERDPREFAYLNSNYGIGNPLDVKFTPVVKNRIDALIGLLSTTDFDWKVSIGDKESIEQTELLKTAAVLEKIYAEFKPVQSSASVAPTIDYLYKQAVKEVAKSWKSIFQQNADNLLRYYRDDVDLDMKGMRKDLMEDLATLGRCAYRVICDEYGRIPYPEILLPENLYVETRRDQKFYKEASQAVYVRYLTVEEVLTKYGNMLTEDQKKDLLSVEYAKHFLTHTQVEELSTWHKRKDAAADDARVYTSRRYLRVYETEWLANNPVNIDKDELYSKYPLMVNKMPFVEGKVWRQDRYQSVRIGTDIYVGMGKSDFVRRTRRNPLKAYLSINGASFEVRNGNPYSLVAKTKAVQDMTDILYYHRDNLIANSGVNGSRMDMATIPNFLDPVDPMNRVMKAIALKKNGTELYNSAQDEGSAGNKGVSSDFKAGADGQLLSQINAAIQMADEEASRITGVTPQMMGLIEQRDAVSNVKVGINQASLVMKNIFDQHDAVVKHMLTDLLYTTQVSMEDEEDFTGTFLAEKGYETFKIFPDTFSYTDYNIHIVSASNEFHKLNNMKEAVAALANTGAIDPAILLRVTGADSTQEIIRLVEQSADDESAITMQKLQQQVEELGKQNEQMQKKLEQNDTQKLAIEQQKMNADMEIKRDEQKRKWKETQDSSGFKAQELENEEEIIGLERDQLYLDAENNAREVRNDLVK
jgi:hypothetical protein